MKDTRVRESAIVIPVGTFRRILVALLALIFLIVVILVVRGQLTRIGASLFPPGVADVIDRNTYQAVFLTNGSTYFGKLEAQGDEWFLLSDVFYLTASEQTGTQLIKRGSEAQGPREPMIIPKSQVLFIENLRDDGEVITAIKKFKSGALPVATPPAATVPPTPALPTPTPRPSATR